MKITPQQQDSCREQMEVAIMDISCRMVDGVDEMKVVSGRAGALRVAIIRDAARLLHDRSPRPVYENDMAQLGWELVDDSSVFTDKLAEIHFSATLSMIHVVRDLNEVRKFAILADAKMGQRHAEWLVKNTDKIRFSASDMEQSIPCPYTIWRKPDGQLVCPRLLVDGEKQTVTLDYVDFIEEVLGSTKGDAYDNEQLLMEFA